MTSSERRTGWKPTTSAPLWACTSASTTIPVLADVAGHFRRPEEQAAHRAGRCAAKRLFRPPLARRAAGSNGVLARHRRRRGLLNLLASFAALMLVAQRAPMGLPVALHFAPLFLCLALWRHAACSRTLAWAAGCGSWPPHCCSAAVPVEGAISDDRKFKLSSRARAKSWACILKVERMNSGLDRQEPTTGRSGDPPFSGERSLNSLRRLSPLCQ